MDFGLKGKVAFVTGGSHGIGRATALALAREGCRVSIAARGKSNLDATASALRAMGASCLAIQADLSIEEDLDKAFDAVINEFGSVHVLVNNVGGGGRWGDENVLQTAERVWTEAYDKNVGIALRLTLKALPFMQRQNWGRVITITSIYGVQAGGRPWFNLAKVAQSVLMKNLALRREFARRNITFNSVAPGALMIPDTGWEAEQQKDPEGFRQRVDHEFTAGRLGLPEEVADVVAFVASERSSYMNGACLLVDGGQSPVI